MLKMLAICPLSFVDLQIEIHRAFIYTLGILAKEYEITLIIDQDKKYKIYQKLGWLDFLTNKRVKIAFVGNCLKDYSEKKRGFEIDYSFLNLFKRGYDEFFIYSSVILGGVSEVKKCNYDKDCKNYDRYKRCTFFSNRSKYNSCIIINTLISKYRPKIKQVIVDYMEVRFDALYDNCIIFGNYKDKSNRTKTMYLFENFLFRKGIVERNKVFKFYFGYSAMTMKRKYLSKIISENVVENEKFKITCKDKFWKDMGRKDIVNQTEYYDLISKTEFSLIAPAYDANEVSYIRILECLSRNCIPIILSNVQIEKCFNNFKDLFQFYKDNNLFYDINSGMSINDFINKLNYDKLIMELNELKTLKRFKDRSFMRERLLQAYIGADKNV